MGLLGKVAFALRLNKALGRLEEAKKMGKLQTALYGLVTMVVTGVMQQFTAACPGIVGQASSILVAGLIAGAALWAARPRESAGAKALVVGLSSALISGVLMKLDATCPGIVQQLPSILTAGAMAGLALWLRSPKESPKN